jgi:hypothetical protein
MVQAICSRRVQIEVTGRKKSIGQRFCQGENRNAVQFISRGLARSAPTLGEDTMIPTLKGLDTQGKG